MKNFILGVLVMLCLGLMIQNNNLHNQIARNNKNNQEKVASIDKPKKMIKKTPVQVSEPYRYNPEIAAAPNRDPRCPSHLPYFDSHWGCVVKRP